MTLSRRSFLSTTSRVLLLRGLGREASAHASPAAPTEEGLAGLKRLVTEPPASAKPMTRWWWFGGAVTPEEITRELTFMREAGLRGAEIQPVYPVAVDDPERGIRHLRYFTEEWFEALRHAAREARRLGLQLDFTPGSGWPYGGPFVPVSLAARRLRVLSKDVVGPRVVSWDLTAHVGSDERVVAVVAAPLRPDRENDLDRSVVLSGQPRTESNPDLGSGLWVRGWQVPAGEWRLVVVVDTPTGQQVKRATLGMEGYVLDHHSREAMELFLRAAGDRVMDALRPAGDPAFHSVFCDSLEVYGADWTPTLLAEFRSRRGYDLAPLLPALWSDGSPQAPLVRHDYNLTLSELSLEGFFRPLAEWAERRGMTARVQAHGARADVLQAYGLAHVPEGENIFGGDLYRVNLRHRRLASSAAHLYGKPLASAETYTWLRTPLYLTTLEQMKAATDAVFLDGVNHVVNHGYSYSPPQAGEPGWAFYAASEINHTNTWWRHYPHLARYVQRAQALLQRGVAVNPIALYAPVADVFSRCGAGDFRIDVEIERQLGTGLVTLVRQAGYDFDLVHDHALATLARVEGGRLRVGTGEYAVVVVPAVRFMPAETAARLAELVDSGGHVMFIERLPEAAPGLADHDARTAAVERSLARIWTGRKPAPGDTLERGRGGAALVADASAARARLDAVLGPDFRIVAAGRGGEADLAAAVENVGFVHRRAEGVDIYLVANVSGEERALRVQFAVGHRSPVRWSLEGDDEPALAFAYVAPSGRRATEVELRLLPFESCVVVFGRAASRPLVTRTDLPGPFAVSKTRGRVEIVAPVSVNGGYAVTLDSGCVVRVEVTGLPAPVSLEGPWTLALGQRPLLALGRLQSWNDLPEGRTFSGWGTYRTTFDLPGLGDHVEWTIDLGRVHETAEVWLNGRTLGAAWKAPRRLKCGDALVAGPNRLEVDVANLWIHQQASAPPPPEWRTLEETVGIRWGRYGEVAPERMPPSGLLGPVQLVPVKRVSFAGR